MRPNSWEKIKNSASESDICAATSGLELHQAIAEFSETYPEVEINIVNGTHEELYDMLRFGGVELVLNDQRRAFSDLYTNFELMQCGCYVEISRHNPLSGQDYYQIHPRLRRQLSVRENE